MSDKRTPTVYFTSLSNQFEDFSSIKHEDANCCGHFVGFPIIKTTCFHGGSTLCYFEILGEKFDEFPAFLFMPAEFLPSLGMMTDQDTWKNGNELVLSRCCLLSLLPAAGDARIGMKMTSILVILFCCRDKTPYKPRQLKEVYFDLGPK